MQAELFSVSWDSWPHPKSADVSGPEDRSRGGSSPCLCCVALIHHPNILYISLCPPLSSGTGWGGMLDMVVYNPQSLRSKTGSEVGQIAASFIVHSG